MVIYNARITMGLKCGSWQSNLDDPAADSIRFPEPSKLPGHGCTYGTFRKEGDPNIVP